MLVFFKYIRARGKNPSREDATKNVPNYK